MDPTKPILDLYTDSYTREPRSKQQYTHNKSTFSHANYTKDAPSTYTKNAPSNQQSRMIQKKELSYEELKEKYQDLYQAYHERTCRLEEIEGDSTRLRSENIKLREEVNRLSERNDELHGTLLSKNLELEETYRKLQGEIRGGSTVKSNDGAIDKLEEGLRQAIMSNYDILRESAVSELRQYLHS